jgi:O-6-methylguanine DNA methyltransferase
MTTVDRDPIAEALGQLSTAPPADFLDRVVSQWARVPGPIGELYLAFTDRGISYVRTSDAVAGSPERFLDAYRSRFARPLRPAERLPAGLLPALRTGRSGSLRYDLRGLTPFAASVLDATRRIPAGQTRPYGWVAREIGRPGAVRAVGTALGGNPVPILIPCHRVTRSDGTAGEYVFGATVKEALLRAEDVDLDRIHALARDRVFYLGSDTTGIVCFPTCHHARRITAAHRRGFRSVGEAVDAGYRPCQVCRPGAAATA